MLQNSHLRGILENYILFIFNKNYKDFCVHGGGLLRHLITRKVSKGYFKLSDSLHYIVFISKLTGLSSTLTQRIAIFFYKFKCALSDPLEIYNRFLRTRNVY